MTKWEVETQQRGITDPMRLNILSTIRTAIDTHGPSKVYEICSQLNTWLNATYKGEWAVTIGERGKFSWCFNVHEEKYLCVRETDLKWIISICKVRE